MKYGELASRLEAFRDALIEHRRLYASSLHDLIPNRPIRNGEALERQQRNLSKKLAVLNPHLTRLSPSRTKVHRATGVYWDIFMEAIGNNTAIIKGESLNDAILQLEGMVEVAKMENPDAELEAKSGPEPRPAAQASGKGRGDQTISISGGNVNIGEHGTINVTMSVAEFLETAVAEVERRSSDPAQASGLRRRLSALLEHPLGRRL